MFLKQEFEEWRASPLTQQMLTDIAQAAEDQAGVLFTRRQPDPTADQWIRGFLSGIGACAGWKPEMVTEDGTKVPDEI